MRQYQFRIADTREAIARMAPLLETAFEEDGAAISWSETTEGWILELWTFTDDPAAVAAAMAGCVGVDPAAVSATAVDEGVDWVSVSLEGLKPVIAGRFVVHGAHDRDRLPAGLIGLEIEANQAFGTGHHPTTWGCLVALSRLLRVRRFRSVFDLGTGSGVLAIAVARDARLPVIASDIDPLSVRITAENAVLNRVGDRVTAVTAAGFDHALLRARHFDLVVANILADPLKQLSPRFRAATRSGARVVLSGILSFQAPAVLAAFRAQDFAREREIRREGWSTLVLRRL